MTVTVLDECLWPGLDEDIYHADPVPSGSLSQSGARYLLPPYTPAHFDHYRRHPRKSSRAQELGSAAHTELLGTGVPIEVYPEPDDLPEEERVKDYNRKDPQAWKRKVQAAGRIPLLYHQAQALKKMVAKVRAHPDASALLTPGEGVAEASFFCIDDETGVWRRGRADFIRGVVAREGRVHVLDGRVIIVDYKTKGKGTAHPSSFARDVWEYGYFIQGPWYGDCVKAVCDLDEPPEFWWVVQETEPPYLVNCFTLDWADEEWGRRCARAALRRYADCAAAGAWPEHERDKKPIELPRYGHYVLREWEQAGLFYDRRYDTPTPGAAAPGLYDDTYRGW